MEKIDLQLIISYQEPFVVSVPVLCFQIVTVNGSGLWNFYRKLDSFWEKLLENMFCFFFSH